MIVHLFPEPDKRAKAVGAYAVASVGGALGLLLGGVLTRALSWHWIFLVNLPIGVVGFLLTLRYVPEDGIPLRSSRWTSLAPCCWLPR